MNNTQTILKDNLFDNKKEKQTFFYENDKDKRFFKSTLIKVDERLIEEVSRSSSGFEEKQLSYEYTATFLEKDDTEKSYKVEQKPAMIGEDYYYILDKNDNIEHIFSYFEKEKLKDFITIAYNIEKPKRSLLSKIFLRNSNSFMLSEMILSPFITMTALFWSYSWYYNVDHFSSFETPLFLTILSFIIPAIYYELQFKLSNKYDQFDKQYIDNVYSQFD